MPYFLRSRQLVACLIILFISDGYAFSHAWADPPDKMVTPMPEIERAKNLLENGQFGVAAEVLEQFIATQDLSEVNLRYAYNVLVLIKLQAMQAAEARDAARTALEHYPDIYADPAEFPVTVNDTYDDLRSKMFGALAVTQPDGARVFLDGDYIGTAPLLLDFVPKGHHSINLSKSGFRDDSRQIEIESGATLRLEPTMSKSRGLGWWMVRVVPTVAVGTLIATSTGGGVSASPTGSATGLPSPPASPQ